MKSLISVSLAVLLGVVSLTQVTEDTTMLATVSVSLTPQQQAQAAAAAMNVADQTNTQLQKLSCMLYDDLTFFDIRGLAQENPFQYGNFIYTFCARSEINSESTWAYISVEAPGVSSIFGSGTQTYALTDDSTVPSKVLALENTSDNTLPRHLYYEFKNGDQCVTDSSRNYQTSIEIFCDTSATTITNAKVDFTDSCYPKLSFSHTLGCPKLQVTSVIRFFSDHGWALALVLLAGGLITGLFGGKYFEWVLCILGGSIVFFTTVILCSLIGGFSALDAGSSASPTQITIAIVLFILCASLAIGVGVVLKKVTRTGIMLAGVAAGFALGFSLYAFIIANFYANWIVMGVMAFLGAAIFGFLAYKYEKLILVYLTSFIGAYFFVRGLSIFIGGFPNELVLYAQIQAGVFDGLGWQFYVYIVGVIVAGVLAVIFQIKRGYNHDEEDEPAFKAAA